MIIKGKVHKFGDNINTDDIIAAKYLDSQDPVFLGSKCMENIDAGFSKRVEKGDIIVAGKNFGCGSSREHAPWAIKGCGVSLVIAESFARIFYRNAINVGLPILVCKDAAGIKAGSVLEVDLMKGVIIDTGPGKEFTPLEKISDFNRKSTPAKAKDGLKSSSSRAGKEKNSLTGYTCEAFPSFMQEIIKAAGLINWIKRK